MVTTKIYWELQGNIYERKLYVTETDNDIKYYCEYYAAFFSYRRQFIHSPVLKNLYVYIIDKGGDNQHYLNIRNTQETKEAYYGERYINGSEVPFLLNPRIISKPGASTPSYFFFPSFSIHPLNCLFTRIIINHQKIRIQIIT